MAGKGQKRKDKDRIVLKSGESQRPNGTYDYRWTGRDGKRHVVYAKTLEELREKEAQIANDKFEGIKAESRNVTINEMFDLWCQIKRGLKNNTLEPDCASVRLRDCDGAISTWKKALLT